MTKTDLDDRARSILDSKHPRNIRNNMVLASTEDLSRIFCTTLRKIQKQHGMWDTYTLEIVSGDSAGYTIKFPEGQEMTLKWEIKPKI